MELHTFSSLNAAFLPQYRHTMDLADEAIVFFNPEVVTQKNYENSVLLIMTSGNFSGIDIKELATQLIHK